MRTRLRHLVALLLATAAAEGSAAAHARDPDFVPARGWILVRHGTVEDIQAAIVDYDGLAREERPGTFEVELHPQANGSVAVRFPQGLPAYDMTNMTGWLDAPPDQPDVGDAAVWMTSPGNGREYSLWPEHDNAWGDTLVGASADGLSVRVYLPECALQAISMTQAYAAEPDIEKSPAPVRLRITLDTNTGFGNPRFLVEGPAGDRGQP